MAAPKILVVDDQPINVQLLKRKLEREGLTVVAAYNGLEALDLVAKDKPDLILLDVMMPDMDGIEVCQRLQSNEETRPIPVIFITARTSKEGKLEGLGVGAVDYITKPIDLDETLARVQTQLRFVAINREMADLQRRLAESRRIATIGSSTAPAVPVSGWVSAAGYTGDVEVELFNQDIWDTPGDDVLAIVTDRYLRHVLPSLSPR